jgi:hypothetical protein
MLVLHLPNTKWNTGIISSSGRPVDCCGNAPETVDLALQEGYMNVLWLLENALYWKHLFGHCPHSPGNARGHFLLNSKNADLTSEAILGLIFWGEFWTSWNRSRNINLQELFQVVKVESINGILNQDRRPCSRNIMLQPLSRTSDTTVSWKERGCSVS